MTIPLPRRDDGDGGGDYPQAIADDYPGWAVERENGQWIAWCPALTVQSTTAARLRALIEQAIGGDGEP